MVGYVLRIFAVGTIVVSSIEYAYGVISGRKVTKEFAEAGLVLFLKLRSGCHSEIKEKSKVWGENWQDQRTSGCCVQGVLAGTLFLKTRDASTTRFRAKSR